MKTFVGSGQGSPKDAVRQATQGLDRPSAILFMSPYNMIREAAALLKEMYPEVPAIGTTGKNLINGRVSENTLGVLGLFEDARVSCGIMQKISECPVASAWELKRKMEEVSPGREDTVCVEYCTGAEEKLITTFTACLGTRGIQLMGGTAFGIPEGKASVVAYNGEVYEDACAYAFIKNLTGKARVYKENIYVKHSNKSHFATKVDVAKKALIELDGRPAADVYSSELGIARSQIIDNVLINPIGRAVGEQVFISSMKSLEANGTILNYKRINKNDCIYFLDLGDYQEIERNTREEIKRDMKRVSLVLSVDCAHRDLLYEKNGYMSAYAKDMASLGAHMGVVVGGEQYNNQHVNQTMVCAVFE